MKILLYTDIHVDKSYFNKPLLTKTETYRVRNFILETLETYKPDLQLFLGDMFHVVDNIDIVPYIRIRQFLEGKGDIAGFVDYSNIYMLPGNHDFLSMKSDFNLLDTINNVYSEKKGYKTTVFKNSKVAVIPMNDIDSTFIFVPYIHDPEILKQTMLAVKEKMKLSGTKNNFVFGHFGITDAENFYSRGSSKGMISTRDLGKHFFNKLTRMYLGHFHTRNSFKDDKIQFIGSTHCHNFNDVEDLNRGALLLDIDGNGNFTETYINNPYSPIYVKTSFEQLNEYNGKYSNKNRNVYLDIISNQKDNVVSLLKENAWIANSFDYYRVRNSDDDEKFLALKNFDFELNNYSGLNIVDSFKTFLAKEKDRIDISENDISTIMNIIKYSRNGVSEDES